MASYEYKNLNAHKLAHNQFVATLQRSLHALLNASMQECLHFYVFLCNWILKHIAVSDKKWASYIKENFPKAKIE